MSKSDLKTPWTVRQSVAADEWLIEDTEAKIVACVPMGFIVAGSDYPAEQAAALIAAAPDLYEALRVMIHLYDNALLNDEVADGARAALVKARGDNE